MCAKKCNKWDKYKHVLPNYNNANMRPYAIEQWIEILFHRVDIRDVQIYNQLSSHILICYITYENGIIFINVIAMNTEISNYNPFAYNFLKIRQRKFQHKQHAISRPITCPVLNNCPLTCRKKCNKLRLTCLNSLLLKHFPSSFLSYDSFLNLQLNL